MFYCTTSTFAVVGGIGSLVTPLHEPYLTVTEQCVHDTGIPDHNGVKLLPGEKIKANSQEICYMIMPLCTRTVHMPYPFLCSIDTNRVQNQLHAVIDSFRENKHYTKQGTDMLGGPEQLMNIDIVSVPMHV